MDDRKKECGRLLKEIRDEYKYEEPDIFDNGDIEMRKLKWVINNKLDTVERTIILLYSETGSLRKLGSILNCSASTARPEVNRIKAKVQEELMKLKDIENI